MADEALERTGINVIRGLAMDAVQKANSGHPGTAMALAPLRQFGLKTSILTSLQAISGAGYPGVPSWDTRARALRA